MRIQVSKVSPSCISGKITDEIQDISWSFFGIYGPPYVEQKEDFWRKLSMDILGCNQEWICFGDLNVIKSQDEKYAEKHNIRAGVGMAAIQIGILKRMFVIYFVDEDGQEVAYQLVNPIIIESSVKKAALQGGEGCLSVDNPHYGLVHRSYHIKLKAYDALIGQDVEIDAKGYEAIVLQHEYDHLNGTFYYDRIDKNSPENPYPGEQII